MADNDETSTTTTTTTSSEPQVSGTEERCALELRAETINLVAVKRAARRGVSDRLEIGKESASDTATGHEEVNVEGNYRLEGKDIETSASILKRTYRGRLNLRLYSDTLMLSGAVSETFAGVVTSGAGMCDVLGAAGGLRVTTSGDFRLINGLAGMEEKPGTSINDKLLLEIAATSFQREYGVASYKAAFASYSGEKLLSMEAGTWSMLKASLGFRQQIKGQAKIKSGRTAMRPNPGMAPAADPGLSAAVRLGLLTGIGKGAGKGIARSKNLLDVDSAAKAATNAADFAPTPPVRSSSLGFFKKNRVFLQDEIAPGAREAIPLPTNYAAQLESLNQPPPVTTIYPIYTSPPASTLQLPESGNSSYLHRTSTANGAPEGLLSTADNGTDTFRYESAATLTDDLANHFNIRYSQLDPELLDPNLNIIPTSPINKSSNLPSLDVIQPKSVSNQSIGVYELLDTATIAAKTDSTYSTPSSIQLLRQNHNQSRYLPSIPSGLEIGPSQLKAGSGAAQESTEGFGGARRATQYDASGSTSPRPRLSQEGADWVPPSISRPNSGAYDTVGFQVPSPYHSTMALNKSDSIEDLEQISDSRRSSIVSPDTEISVQQIIKNNEQRVFELDPYSNPNPPKPVTKGDLTADKLDMYLKTKRQRIQNQLISYVKSKINKDMYFLVIDSPRSETSRKLVVQKSVALETNYKALDAVSSEINKFSKSSTKTDLDKFIAKRVKSLESKINKLKKKNTSNQGFDIHKHYLDLDLQYKKMRLYEDFSSDFNKLTTNYTNKVNDYPSRIDTKSFLKKANDLIQDTDSINPEQRLLMIEGLATFKKGSDPIVSFQEKLSDIGNLPYQPSNVAYVIEQFRLLFTTSEQVSPDTITTLSNIFFRIDRADISEFIISKNALNVTATRNTLYDEISAAAQLARQSSGRNSTTPLKNPYTIIKDPLYTRDPSQLSEIEKAKILPSPDFNAALGSSDVETSNLIFKAEELLRIDVKTSVHELNNLLSDINKSLSDPNITDNHKLSLWDKIDTIRKRLGGTFDDITESSSFRAQLEVPDEPEYVSVSAFKDKALEESINKMQRSVLEDYKNGKASDAVQFNVDDIYAPRPAKPARRLSSDQQQLADLIGAAESNPKVSRIEDFMDATADPKLEALPKNLDSTAPNSIPQTAPLLLNKTTSPLLFDNSKASVVKFDDTNATDGTLGNLTNKGPASVVSETDEIKPVLHNPSFKPADRLRYDFLAEPDVIDSARDLNYRDGPTIVQKIELEGKTTTGIPGGGGDKFGKAASDTSSSKAKAKQRKRKQFIVNDTRQVENPDDLSIEPNKVTASEQDSWTLRDQQDFLPAQMPTSKKPSPPKVAKKPPRTKLEGALTPQLVDDAPKETLESLGFGKGRQLPNDAPRQIEAVQEAENTLKSAYEVLPQQHVANSPVIRELAPVLSTTSKSKRSRLGGILKKIRNLFKRKDSTKGVKTSKIKKGKLRHADTVDQNVASTQAAKKWNDAAPETPTPAEARQKVAELVEEAKERAIDQGEGRLQDITQQRLDFEGQRKRGELTDWDEADYKEIITQHKVEESYLTHLKNGDIKAADAVMENELERLRRVDVDDSASFFRMGEVNNVVQPSVGNMDDITELNSLLRHAGYPEDVTYGNFLVMDLDAFADSSTSTRAVDAVADPSASARAVDAGDSNNKYAALDHNFKAPKATKNDPITATNYSAIDENASLHSKPVEVPKTLDNPMLDEANSRVAEIEKIITGKNLEINRLDAYRSTDGNKFLTEGGEVRQRKIATEIKGIEEDLAIVKAVKNVLYKANFDDLRSFNESLDLSGVHKGIRDEVSLKLDAYKANFQKQIMDHSVAKIKTQTDHLANTKTVPPTKKPLITPKTKPSLPQKAANLPPSHGKFAETVQSNPASVANRVETTRTLDEAAVGVDNASDIGTKTKQGFIENIQKRLDLYQEQYDNAVKILEDAKAKLSRDQASVELQKGVSDAQANVNKTKFKLDTRKQANDILLKLDYNDEGKFDALLKEELDKIQPPRYRSAIESSIDRSIRAFLSKNTAGPDGYSWMPGTGLGKPSPPQEPPALPPRNATNLPSSEGKLMDTGISNDAPLVKNQPEPPPRDLELGTLGGIWSKGTFDEAAAQRIFDDLTQLAKQKLFTNTEQSVVGKNLPGYPDGSEASKSGALKKALPEPEPLSSKQKPPVPHNKPTDPKPTSPTRSQDPPPALPPRNAANLPSSEGKLVDTAIPNDAPPVKKQPVPPPRNPELGVPDGVGSKGAFDETAVQRLFDDIKTKVAERKPFTNTEQSVVGKNLPGYPDGSEASKSGALKKAPPDLPLKQKPLPSEPPSSKPKPPVPHNKPTASKPISPTRSLDQTTTGVSKLSPLQDSPALPPRGTANPSSSQGKLVDTAISNDAPLVKNQPVPSPRNLELGAPDGIGYKGAFDETAVQRRLDEIDAETNKLLQDNYNPESSLTSIDPAVTKKLTALDLEKEFLSKLKSGFASHDAALRQIGVLKAQLAETNLFTSTQQSIFVKKLTGYLDETATGVDNVSDIGAGAKQKFIEDIDQQSIAKNQLTYDDAVKKLKDAKVKYTQSNIELNKVKVDSAQAKVNQAKSNLDLRKHAKQILENLDYSDANKFNELLKKELGKIQSPEYKSRLEGAIGKYNRSFLTGFLGETDFLGKTDVIGKKTTDATGYTMMPGTGLSKLSTPQLEPPTIKNKLGTLNTGLEKTEVPRPHIASKSAPPPLPSKNAPPPLPSKNAPPPLPSKNAPPPSLPAKNASSGIDNLQKTPGTGHKLPSKAEVESHYMSVKDLDFSGKKAPKGFPSGKGGKVKLSGSESHYATIDFDKTQKYAANIDGGSYSKQAQANVENLQVELKMEITSTDGTASKIEDIKKLAIKKQELASDYTEYYQTAYNQDGKWVQYNIDKAVDKTYTKKTVTPSGREIEQNYVKQEIIETTKKEQVYNTRADFETKKVQTQRDMGRANTELQKAQSKIDVQQRVIKTVGEFDLGADGGKRTKEVIDRAVAKAKAAGADYESVKIQLDRLHKRFYDADGSVVPLQGEDVWRFDEILQKEQAQIAENYTEAKQALEAEQKNASKYNKFNKKLAKSEDLNKDQFQAKFRQAQEKITSHEADVKAFKTNQDATNEAVGLIRKHYDFGAGNNEVGYNKIVADIESNPDELFQIRVRGEFYRLLELFEKR